MASHLNTLEVDTHLLLGLLYCLHEKADRVNVEVSDAEQKRIKTKTEP